MPTFAHTYTLLLTCVESIGENKAIRGRQTMNDIVRIQVLISPDEANRFDSYCRDRGFKKSTLIARLIREHLDAEKYWPQKSLFESHLEGQPRK